MPHIHLEYSKNLAEHIEMPKLLADLHTALADQDVDKARIKVRAFVTNDSVVGVHDYNEGSMMHVTLSVLQGRDVPLRKQYGQALHNVLKNAVPDHFSDCAVTLEVREMLSDTYFV